MSQQMTHKEFCIWLEGFFMRGGREVTVKQWHEIGKRLHKTMNPLVAVGDGGVRDVTTTLADYFEKYGVNVPVPGPLPKQERNHDSIPMKEIVDECEQGEPKKESTQVKTIADIARESMSKDISPSLLMDQLTEEVNRITGVLGVSTLTPKFVPPFTPQEPFKGEGY